MGKSNTRSTDRNTLLANGYPALPLLSNGKGLHIKGWSRLEVTPEWLDEYARRTDYGNTGIRCDDLAAFDLDITDEALCDQAEQIVEKICGPTELCRVGRAPKRLLLYGLKGKGPFKSLRTAKYGEHRGELLCGNGRQFAAFGRHPSGSTYTWDADSPLDTPRDELPEITYKRAQKALDAIDDMLKATGIPEDSPALRLDGTGGQEWDLTDDFECMIGGEAITWGELKPQLTVDGEFGNIRREDGEFGDSDAVHFMLTIGSGEPCIHDFIRDCTHYDPVVNPQLATALPPPPAATSFAPANDFLANWVLLRDGTVRRIERPQRAYDLSKWKASYKHLVIPAPTARNPLKTEPATDAWQRDSATMRADYAALRPDLPDETLVTDGPETVLNTYLPPEHPDTGGEIDTLLEFVEHLLPKKAERDLFLDWHALKVAHPSWRMHGMITVTRAHGTGRGTWFQILEKLFGAAYVRKQELHDLIGAGSQSQYNEALADSLIMYVPEALEEKEDQSRWVTRHVAFERLKQICEPIAGQEYIKRKYGRNSVETVFSSLLISSNHTDALAIEPGDRRLIVLDNTERPLWEAPRKLAERIQEWKLRPENIGALHRQLRLRAVGVTYDPFGEPPMTPAKEAMISAGQSDMDIAFEHMVASAAGDIVTPSQWRVFAQDARQTLQLDLPHGEQLDKALTAVITKHGRRIEALQKTGIKIKSTQQRPWIIRRFDTWKGCTDNAAIRAEILKNGDPGGAIVQFPPKSI